MIDFKCKSCKEYNQIVSLETTDTGDWVIECDCTARETITLESFNKENVNHAIR